MTDAEQEPFLKRWWNQSGPIWMLTIGFILGLIVTLIIFLTQMQVPCE